MPIGVYIEFEALPGRFDGLMQRLREESEHCMRHDEGCLRMELAVPQKPDGRIMLIELWRDEAAIELHRNQPGHSHDWQKDYIASKRVAVCNVVASPAAPEA
ncbi:MAG: putative quinol monooxygenase [Ottowia sp.]|uniref:putative quinol monooxygenase n=1 Tax=Ottowia sp. TaxID=1898956 RepID=UPI003C7364D2